MSRLIGTFVAFCIAVAVCPASAKDTIYKDPRKPSYTLLVPNGWEAVANKQGVKLSGGAGWGQLLVENGAHGPVQALASFTKMFENQYKDFRVDDTGKCRFGGGDGVYTVLSGVAPNGKHSITRIVTMTNGVLTYVLFTGADTAAYPTLKADLDRIQESFTPDSV
jgi:hypothetical protein